MIVFYRSRPCAFCDEVVERLRAMVVAHRIIIVDDDALTGTEDSANSVPRLVEGRQTYKKAEIPAFLDMLGREMMIQREMQGDSCKIDPDTGLEC